MKNKVKSNSSLTKLFRYVRNEMLPMIVAIVLSIATVGLTIAATFVLKNLTNYISDAAKTAIDNPSIAMSSVLSMREVAKLCGGLVAIYVVAVACNFLQSFIMTGVNNRISQRLRNELSRKINRLPLSYFESRKIGDTMSVVANDVDTVTQSLNSAISTTVSSAVQIVLVIAIMFFTSWQMSLTAVATVPLSMVIMLVVVKISQKYFKQQQANLGKVNGTAEECYSGLVIIKAFACEHWAKNKFEKENSSLQKAMFSANAISSLSHPFSTFISKLGYVAVCVVGGVLISQNLTDIGSLAAFLIYINLFQQPLGQIAQIANVFQTMSASSTRIFDLLDAPEQSNEQDKQQLLLPADVKGKVEFKNVKFSYKQDLPVIKDFTATVEPGQKVAIVGPTGAGKTTLVNLLMRFYELNEGDILIDGVSIKEMPRESVRALFSMVLQDTWLFDGTIKENLQYTTDNITDEQILDALKAANLDHYVEGLADGIYSQIDSAKDLSGGQRQLLTIARAMLQNSPMMILDEATSNVDTRTEESIQSAMDTLTQGRTSFVIAHRLSTIQNADLILVLKDGDIIEKGNHETLLAQNGFYAQLYNSQFRTQ